MTILGVLYWKGGTGSEKIERYTSYEPLVCAAGSRAVLDFLPNSGTIPPHSSQNITATFAPEAEGPINCNAAFVVRRKAARLGLNVKGEGAATRVRLEMEVGGQTVELSRDTPNDIDFGQVTYAARPRP